MSNDVTVSRGRPTRLSRRYWDKLFIVQRLVVSSFSRAANN